ncbi:MAG: alpha-2-macroglobulin family protein [Myxococcota bacterium]
MPRPLLKLAILTFVFLSLVSCRNRKTKEGPAAPDSPVPVAPADVAPGLTITLSHADATAAERVPTTLAEATTLGDKETAAVLGRLAPLEAAETTEFALREASKPPPRTGATVVDSFPPPPKKAGKRPKPKGPLEVLRFAPEGDVPLAPHMSVTFNHPMVAVTSVDALAAADVPVELSPMPEGGKWRWVGTKTLLFDPDERLPMATRYEVTVPRGTRSSVGTKLKKKQTWSFSTPPPTLVRQYPAGDSVPRQPVVFVAFDQRIDEEAVLRSVNLSAAGKSKRAVRLARADEIADDAVVQQLVAQQQPGRWLAFVPESPLPNDSKVTVTLEAGLPSAEGPLTTLEPQQFRFRIFGRMKVVEHQCGYGGRCAPGFPLTIRFSNRVDAEEFDQAMVSVEPEVPQLQTRVYGDTLGITGDIRGETRYTVTLSPDILDVYEQRLGDSDPLVFDVGAAPQSLFMQSQGLTVLDPESKGKVSVYSVNHEKLRLRLWKVKPKDWREYLIAMETAGRDPERLGFPGVQVVDRVIDVAPDPNAMVETLVDLAPALDSGLGHAVIVVEQTEVPAEPWQMQRSIAWVQSTRLGLQGHIDSERMLVWATGLADGAPREGIEVELLHIGAKARTGAGGLASLPLAKVGAHMIVAREGADVAFLPESVYWWNPHGSWSTAAGHRQLRWHVYDDRGLYRPGEEVSIKGWIREIDLGKGGDVRRIAGAHRTIDYRVTDSQGNEVTKGELKLNAWGAFDVTVDLPDTMNLGYAYLQMTLRGSARPGKMQAHGFRVEEFRRPEYEVKTRISEGPHVVGDHAVSTVEADYFAGGGLANADVHWSVSANPGHYQPPGHDQYAFGHIEPWWMFWRAWGPAKETRKTHRTFEALTDAVGEHHLRMDFVSVDEPRPMAVRVEARVTDVNRQAWSSSSSTVVHPATRYVGLRNERRFVSAGEDIEVDFVVTDIDGAIESGVDVWVKAVRVEYVQERGEMVEKERDPQTCKSTSREGATRCTLATKLGGTHRITAVVVDDQGRLNETRMALWVAGGDLPQPQSIGRDQVLLIADREHYEDGQTAKISVSAPWAPAHGLVTIHRSGLVEERAIELTGLSTTIEVPIADAMTPAVQVQVDLVGSVPRRGPDGKVEPKLPPRPAYATGTVVLDVPPLRRTLALGVEPAKAKIEPGGKTSVSVQVKDADGRPVDGAEVALVVVDEAVLALTGYTLADPLATFYSPRPPSVRSHYLRDHVLLAPSQDMLLEQERGEGDASRLPVGNSTGRDFTAVVEMSPTASMDSAGGAVPDPAPAPGGGGSSGPTPIAVRSDFSAQALFSPSVKTDASGRATVPLSMPDNLTRYRIMAVAVEGEANFGVGESTITARLPLMVRPSAPRFLNFGDAFELPVVLQNQTDERMTVDVAVKASNATLTAGAGRRVVIPAGDRVEVRFPTKAELAGTARFAVGAAAGSWADAASFDLPVWTPATTEAFATYGEIDSGGVVQPVSMPPEVFAQFGGLEVTTSSTALQALTDAVLYLVTYPFECSEQTASRVLAIVALNDVLAAFEAEGLPSPSELSATVKRDIERLSRMQSRDGGFSFWGSGWPSWPYLTVHVSHALERAHIEGFSVPETMRTRALKYLAEIETHFDRPTPQAVRWAIQAYALHVRRLAGEPDPTKARALVDEAGIESLSLEALGWVLPTLHQSGRDGALVARIHRHLDNRVTETAATAHFATRYADGAHLLLHSDRRADAVLLEALMNTKPSSDLIPKLVRGLLGHRRAGRWSSTQENSFVLLSLERYFRQYEKATPNFVAQAWLGDGFVGKHAFRGRTTERHHVEVPMKWLADHEGEQDLVLTKKGKGRMYYRVGMRYAPRNLKLPPYDAGFVVERQYEAVDDQDDVSRDADGAWHIAAGARVRVRLKMVADGRRYHVALVDPLPAGLEPLNPALATTGALPADPEDEERSGWWWARTWYEHQNMRDERVEAFTSLLWSGVHDYDYVARATTPGTFVVPPPKAEEMYHPETFGRGAGDIVIVE